MMLRNGKSTATFAQDYTMLMEIGKSCIVANINPNDTKWCKIHSQFIVDEKNKGTWPICGDYFTIGLNKYVAINKYTQPGIFIVTDNAILTKIDLTTSIFELGCDIQNKFIAITPTVL